MKTADRYALGVLLMLIGALLIACSFLPATPIRVIVYLIGSVFSLFVFRPIGRWIDRMVEGRP